MMAPSLSTSMSSPSFYKENGDDQPQLDNNQQQQQLQEELNNNINENADLNELHQQPPAYSLGELSDLLIPSLHIPDLLDELNRDHCSDTCSSHSFGKLNNNGNNNNSGEVGSIGSTGGAQHAPLYASNGSNKSNNSSIGSRGSKSIVHQIYRTFPYRGSLPSPLVAMINALGDNNRDGSEMTAEPLESTIPATTEKPKPCSTNAIRHSKQYKGLQLNLISNDSNNSGNNGELISNSSNNNSNSLTVDNSQNEVKLSPRVIDSSFFIPPSNNENNNNVANNSNNNNNNNVQSERPINYSLEVQVDSNDEIRDELTSSSISLSSSIHTSSNNDKEQANNNSRWSQLIESLGVSMQSDSSVKDLDELKGLSLDGISLEFENTPKTSTPLLERLVVDSNVEIPPEKPPVEQPSPIVKDNTSSTKSQSPSLSSVSPVSSNTSSPSNLSPLMIPGDNKTSNIFKRIKGNLDLSGDNNVQKKKAALSRTITFADPSSIQNFFGQSNNLADSNNSNNDNATTTTTTTTTSNPIPSDKRDIRPTRISMTSQYPKLQNNNSSANGASGYSNPSAPSKFYYPLLQPQPTSLIRGYSIKADTNIKGLKRAKKVLDMEDEYMAMHPFGGDSQMALFAIFDGHSGKNAAVSAKEILPNVLLKYIQTAKKECGDKVYDMRGVLLSTFKETDAKLLKHEYEGSTATVVLIWRVGEQRYLQSANVGDSSAFISYAGETLTLTKDHRVTDPEEQQRIRDDGVQLGENQTRINGLMVSRALGDHFIKHLNCGLSGEPYISPPISLTPFHSHLIVASDGLWDVISGHRAMELIKTEQKEENMANLLLNVSLKSIKSKDNISLIVSTLT